jgi:ABC-type glycerol-3-phosphate transport system permease component
MSIHGRPSAVVRQGALFVHLRKRPRVSVIVLVAIFVILALVFLVPLYWMTISSLRPQAEIFSAGTNLLPTTITLDNYRRLFSELPYPRWFLNSLVQSGGYAVVTVTVCTLGGFALAKYHFPGRNIIFVLILLSQMLPFHLLIVSLFLLIIRLGLVETYLGAILPLAAHPIGIFFMRQYMLSLEDELLDAARVDGANEYRMFFSVVLPNVRPAVATLFILFALEYWNNLLWPLIVFRQAQNMPLTVGIQSLVSQYRVQYDLVMAGSALATLPFIILFFFLRRQFIEGITAIGTGVEK